MTERVGAQPQFSSSDRGGDVYVLYVVLCVCLCVWPATSVCACPVRCNNSSVYKACAHAILDHNRCSDVASITLLSRVCWEGFK
jgi:hypothetical protein